MEIGATSTLVVFILLSSDSLSMLTPVSCQLSVPVDCLAICETSALSHH